MIETKWKSVLELRFLSAHGFLGMCDMKNHPIRLAWGHLGCFFQLLVEGHLAYI